MTLAELKNSNEKVLRGALLALWLDERGEWEQAHEVAQEIDGSDGVWVHAYLHRKEGDTSNAAYWYRRAGRRVVTGDLKQEWESMAMELLSRR